MNAYYVRILSLGVGKVGGILSVPVVKIALSKAPEYPFLTIFCYHQMLMNCCVFLVQLTGKL